MPTRKKRRKKLELGIITISIAWIILSFALHMIVIEHTYIHIEWLHRQEDEAQEKQPKWLPTNVAAPNERSTAPPPPHKNLILIRLLCCLPTVQVYGNDHFAAVFFFYWNQRCYGRRRLPLLRCHCFVCVGTNYTLIYIDTHTNTINVHTWCPWWRRLRRRRWSQWNFNCL